jgi:hypothetical protein
MHRVVPLLGWKISATKNVSLPWQADGAEGGHEFAAIGEGAAVLAASFITWSGGA